MGKKNGGSSLSPVTYDDDLPLAGGRRVDPQRRKRCLVCASCSLIVGVVLLLGGILTIWVLFPVATEVLIYESIDLKEGSDAWDAWVWFEYLYFYRAFVRGFLTCEWTLLNRQNHTKYNVDTAVCLRSNLLFPSSSTTSSCTWRIQTSTDKAWQDPG